MIVFYNFNEELFLSTPSARRATFSKYLWGCCVEFLSTPSARRATGSRRCTCPSPRISIHALREEGDLIAGGSNFPVKKFLSTPSARRATSVSTHKAIAVAISIHALREEGDIAFRESYPPKEHFYPRPPRGGRRQIWPNRNSPTYFYPRPPRGGRLSRFLMSELRATISIHALREEGDFSGAYSEGGREVFLSTPSARRATCLLRRIWPLFPISIHALREEGDVGLCAPFLRTLDFYPRPPRGGRPYFCAV